MEQTIGWSSFAQTHARIGTGNSFTTLLDNELVELVKKCWANRIPGGGETDVSRKVLVPIDLSLAPDLFYCAPTMELKVGMPVRAEVVVRQEGEDPYVQTSISLEDALKWGFKHRPAFAVDIVCYSAEALLENDGKRSTDCDWEIVTILCTDGEREPMPPLTMARNFLELPGGTKGVYSAEEFARSIYFYSQKGVRVKN